MKKVKLTGKLSLNKETIAKLNNSQMSQLNGGGSQNHQSCSGCTVANCPPVSQACPPLSQVGCLTLDCETMECTGDCGSTPEFAC